MPQTTKASRWRQELRKELPRLLREDIEVRGQVIALLGEYLTTREETAAILAELRQMREDFDRRMDEQGRRIDHAVRHDAAAPEHGQVFGYPAAKNAQGGFAGKATITGDTIQDDDGKVWVKQ